MKASGLPPLYLVRVGSHIDDIIPEDHGFEAAVEFAPDWKNLGKIINGNKEFVKYKKIDRKIIDGEWPKVFDYELTMQCMLMKKLPKYKLFRSVFPSWDNTPRCGRKGTVFINSSPENFEYFMKRQLQNTYKNFKGDERLLFINAWNEWGEGCHLEPDKKFGATYLEACKELTSKSEGDILKENDLMKQIVNLEVTLAEKNRELCDAYQDLELIQNQLAEKNARLEKISDGCQYEIEYATAELKKEMAFLKSSKFWTMRNKYLSLKNKIMKTK
jgi:hypothetical protein